MASRRDRDQLLLVYWMRLSSPLRASKQFRRRHRQVHPPLLGCLSIVPSAHTLGTALMDRMKFTHLFENFMVAVDVLATSPASLQKRLEGAYRSFIDIEPKDFDDEEMQ